MNCRRCCAPMGLIHRCPAGDPRPKPSVEDLARTAAMMHDAGYDVDPITARIAIAYLELLEQVSKERGKANHHA